MSEAATKVEAAPKKVVNTTYPRKEVGLFYSNLEYFKKSVTEPSLLHRVDFLPISKIQKRHRYTHQTVNHGAKEYVNGDAHVNSVEGFWSQFKRSIYGIYHVVSPKHLDFLIGILSSRGSINRKIFKDELALMVFKTITKIPIESL